MLLLPAAAALDCSNFYISTGAPPQVSDAQPTNLHRLVLLGHAHLRLLERIMEGHASALQARGQQAPWDPASPAHRALYG